MNKIVINKLYWIFWYCITMLTGILAGFMISHSIMLGRFFTWLVESGNIDSLRSTYSIFRAANNPQVLYNSFLIISLVFGPIWVILAFLKKKDRIISVIAGLSTFWVSLYFFGLGFAKVEESVMLGIADETTQQLFVSLNVPIHKYNAIIYTFCFLLLLVIALKNKKTID